MLKPKYKMDDEVYFYTTVSTFASKGTIVGIWPFGKENEEVYNYQIEYMATKKDEKGKKFKEKQLELVVEDKLTINKEEMVKKFIPYVKRAIKNKIDLTKKENKEVEKRIVINKEEIVEANKFIVELENELKGYENGTSKVFEE